MVEARMFFGIAESERKDKILKATRQPHPLLFGQGSFGVSCTGRARFFEEAIVSRSHQQFNISSFAWDALPCSTRPTGKTDSRNADVPLRVKQAAARTIRTSEKEQEQSFRTPLPTLFLESCEPLKV